MSCRPLALGSTDQLGPGSEARSATVLGLNDVDKKTGLILRLQDEADLCRNDGANDIAALLDEAVEALRDRNHDTQVGEKWREDSRLETWFPLTAEKLAPLTHMQIVMLWGDRSDGPSTPEIVSFARHVERAHGIGPNVRAKRGQTAAQMPDTE